MNTNENRYDMNKLVDLAGLMCRRHEYGDMRDRFVGHYSIEKPASIMTHNADDYMVVPYSPEPLVYKFGFIWKREIYLIPTKVTEQKLGLYGDDDFTNAQSNFQKIAALYNNPILDGKGVMPNEFMLKEFGDRFEKAMDDFEGSTFWLDDPYVSPLTMAQANYHSAHHTKGVKYAKGHEIVERELYDSKSYSRYFLQKPLLILVKLPLDTLVYNDLSDGLTPDKPLRICPPSAVQDAKTE